MTRRPPRQLSLRVPPPPSLIGPARALLSELRAAGLCPAYADGAITCPGARTAGYGEKIAAHRPELIALLTLERLSERQIVRV